MPKPKEHPTAILRPRSKLGTHYEQCKTIPESKITKYPKIQNEAIQNAENDRIPKNENEPNRI